MGNWNSNRWTEYRRRRVVEDCLAFSVTCLPRHQLSDQFSADASYRWQGDPDQRELSLTIGPGYRGGLMANLNMLNGRGSSCIPICQEVKLHTTILPGGGLRWWFECPTIKGEADELPIICSRRCAVLYLPAGSTKFGCRACHDLTYRKRQQHSKRADYLKKHPEALREALFTAYSEDDIEGQVQALRSAGALTGIPAVTKDRSRKAGS